MLSIVPGRSYESTRVVVKVATIVGLEEETKDSLPLANHREVIVCSLYESYSKRQSDWQSDTYDDLEPRLSTINKPRAQRLMPVQLPHFVRDAAANVPHCVDGAAGAEPLVHDLAEC